MRTKYAAAICALLALTLAQSAFAVDYSGMWSTKYDGHFKKYSKRYFGADFDWRWWKAQAMAESALDSTARSWCGAQGIMQIMPGTWDEIASKIDVTSPWIVKDSIQAGVYYDARMWSIWTAPRPVVERVYFTLASYNAGVGNIIRAQRLSTGHTGVNLWASVSELLSQITGERHAETIRYIQRIQKIQKCFGPLLK